jgi:hypothetical protein
MTERSVAVLYNGLGRYTEALRAAEQATEESYSPLSRQLTLPELIEAAVRTGNRRGVRGPAVVHDDHRGVRLGEGPGGRRARERC